MIKLNQLVNKWSCMAVLVLLPCLFLFLTWHQIAQYGSAVEDLQSLGADVAFDGIDRRPPLTRSFAAFCGVPDYGLVRSVDLDKDFTESDIRPISVFAFDLESLRLKSASITDDGFAIVSDCRHLSDLSVACPKLTGRSMLNLQKLSELTRFHLDSGSIDDSDLIWLGRLSQLEYLQLHNLLVGRNRFRGWVGFNDLAELSLDGCQVDDAGVAQLSKCNLSKLRRLSLAANSQVSDEGIQAVCFGFPSLRFLDIRGTRVSEDSASTLQKMMPRVIVTTDKSHRAENDARRVLQETQIQIQEWPQDAELFTRLGRAQRELGEFAQAIDSLSTAVDIADTTEARLERAKSYAAVEAFERALRDLDVLLLRQPQVSEYLWLRATVLAKLNHLEAALDDLNSAIANQPNSVDIRFDRAVVLEHLERKAESKAEVRKIIELAPNYWPAHTYLANVLLNEGNSAACIKEASRALEICPCDRSALQLRAAAYQAEGDQASAAADLSLIKRISGQ